MSTPTPTHTAVQRFRKKPVVIEAYQWLPDAPMDASAPLWYDEGCASGALYPEFDKTLSINTLEGTMRADPGDWIIRGVKGELYPCKPDIFAATYEPVSLPAPQGEQQDSTCTRCGGSGEVTEMTNHLGPDDYEVPGLCLPAGHADIADRLKADALAIFNDPASRDVIEWYDASLRVGESSSERGAA